MIKLSLIIIGNADIEIDGIEVLSANENNIIETIRNAKGKYIAFLSDKDSITENYLKRINEKIETDFDCCYINYDYILEDKNNDRVLTNPEVLKANKPYYKEYLFSFVFKKEKLEKLINIEDFSNFNEKVDEEFTNLEAIEEVVYFHNPRQSRRINNFIYIDVKEIKEYKNIIYVASGCNGIFNGYISWVRELGNCYKDKYEIVVLYDEIVDETKKLFENYFKCIKRETNTIYICNRLLVTYTSYFYPKNIISLDKSYMFIHGNMSDYENAMKFYDDIYTNYVAVSKIAAERAEGYFPTDNIEYVLNPYKLNDNIQKRLKLTSTLRYADVKRPERIEKMARLMDEMKIPYTWELFTDKNENTNVGGLIYRQRIPNPLPYVKDSDYFVLLSDSESFSYSVVEALSLNTKVVVTPLPVYDEIGVIEDENAIVIPFEYFDEGNEDKLREIIRKMYDEMNKEINYTVSDELQKGYERIFT